jgi:Flp pilus assembly protein TadD
VSPIAAASSATARQDSRRADVALALLLAVAIVAAYLPVLGFGFVGFDDPGYVTANPNVQRGLDREAIVWALTTTHKVNWLPATWLSYQLDVSLFGVSAPAFHGVNLLLHVANALLLYALVRRFGFGPDAALVMAGLFALHPLRVESVAWISERKDVLCGFFALLLLHAWTSWTRRGGVPRYLTALVLFALSLMAKPMAVTFPFVLLLLDWWPLERTRFGPGADAASRGRPTASLLVEKLPFLVVAIAASVVTYRLQRAGGAMADSVALPAPTRLLSALAAYDWYVLKTLWPTDLAALYPNPALLGRPIPFLPAVCGALLLGVIAVLALRDARRRPWLLVGAAIFAGMLVPVIGLVQVGQQATADRYTYLPAIGLGAVLMLAANDLAERLRIGREARVVTAILVLIVLSNLTRAQVGTWRDSVTLARRAIAVTNDNYVMHFNLAVALDEQGDLPGAVVSYAEAVRLRPDLASFRVNHAAALARAGHVPAAVEEYETAMRLDPRDPAARNNLAWLRATHPDAAHRDAAQALALAGALARERPSDPDTLDLLAAALATSGRFAEAERTAAAAFAAAERAGRGDAAAQIAARRALYASGRAYREDPAAAGVAIAPAS